MTQDARRLLLCFGNELHGDDGFGPAVGRRLAAQGLPAGWALRQMDTRGLEALGPLQDCEAAILVDAAAPAGQPGRLQACRADALAAEPVLAGHGMGLGYVLQALAALRPQGLPRLRLLTVQMAGHRPFDLTLSPPVARAVPAAVRRLRRWMQEDGDGR